MPEAMPKATAARLRTGPKRNLGVRRTLAFPAAEPWPRTSMTPWACSPRPPNLLSSSSLCGGQLEDKRDAGTARAGERLHLVRDSPRYPQAVTGQLRKRIKQGRGICGCDQVAVVDLALQYPSQMPYPQSPLPSAMADHIGRQLVNGQDHIPGPVIRESRLTGKSQHFGSQDIQGAGVERQVKERRGIAPSRVTYRTVTGHLRREFPYTPSE
jgi:hypothetical protein